MAELPPPAKNLGGIVKAFNALRAFAASIQPLAGINTTINESENGTSISADINPGGSGAPPHPFHLQDATNATDGTRVRIIYGTVQDFVPAGMSSGDTPSYVLPVDGDAGEIYLILSVDTDGTITALSIDFDDNTPDDDIEASSTSTIYLMIGSYSIDSSGATPKLTATDNLSGSQWFQMCGFGGNKTPLFGLV